MPNAEKCPLDLSNVHLIVQTMASLGVTPESIQQSVVATSNTSSRANYVPLENDEWQVLEAYLPLDPSQSNTMDNRTFVNAVLKAMHRGGRWTDYRNQGPHSDAVRRRFGRWAHQGIWQRLSAEASNSTLSPERKSELKTTALRAERLRLNS